MTAMLKKSKAKSPRFPRLRTLFPILLLVLGCLSLIGCKPKSSAASKKTSASQTKNELPQNNDLSMYFPEFRTSSLGMALNFQSIYKSQGSEQNFKTSIQLKSIVNFEGVDYVEYVIENKGLPGSSPKTVFYRVDEKGVWKKESKTADAVCEIPFPLQLEKGWSLNSKTVMNFGVATKFEDIEVAGKTYKGCLRIEYQITLLNGKIASKATQIEHRAKGIGMVKSVIDYRGGNRLSLELSSVKKAKSS